MSSGHRPRVAVTSWRRRLSTSVADDQLLHTLADDYVACLREVGLTPLVVPHLDAAAAAGLMEVVDGVVLSGGDDVDPAGYGHENTASRRTDPEADTAEVTLLRTARSAALPTLCICRGLQVLNVAFGGTLHQEVTGRSAAHPIRPGDKRAALAHRHPVELVAGSRIASALGATRHGVTSLHHQGADTVGDGLVVTGRAPDGLVEALESADPGWWCLGVQWHPEKSGGADVGIFRAFADAVRVRPRHGVVRGVATV